MQVFPQWTAPAGVLGELTSDAARRADELVGDAARLERSARAQVPAPALAAALAGRTVAVLAEVKRRSPSKGAIAPGLSAVVQAEHYARGGAAGLSILTEPTRFGGSDADLVDVRAASALPVLKKDFHVHAVQMAHARALGASAALLIARAVTPAQLRVLASAAVDVGLEVLVEIRDERELDAALATGARMIGVNNRNLETLEIDPSTSDRLIPLIPPDVVAIAESGISSPADVERYAAVGADAVLVGSSISAAGDATAAVRALAGVARRPRAG